MVTEARTTQATGAEDGEQLLELAAVSDRGTVRAENQDAWSLVPLHPGRGCLLLLADGMGGHAGGREAAVLAVREAAEHLREIPDPHAGLGEAGESANAAIAELRRGHGGAVMGTTLVLAVVSAGRATITNVGDSRAYLLRDGSAAQVTQDHSVLAEAIRAGHLEMGGAGDPPRNLLTRALTGEPVDADRFSVELRAGDVLLLCCDGAWDPLGGDRLARLLDGDGPLEGLLIRACDAALEAGSRDNVTLVACRVAAAGIREGG
ncbi:MAG: serine/threonine protein phosphatase [Chloroflexi bacterium]|nr:serine/threonine protein phosphatase [Chloroflexota bacterium]